LSAAVTELQRFIEFKGSSTKNILA